MVEDYLFKGKKDVSFSIAMRNNLIGSKYIEKVEAIFELKEMLVHHGKNALDVAPNVLFTNDDFGIKHIKQKFQLIQYLIQRVNI